jgi:two-component system, OmpR family, KDP operon response regulator KdpE
MSQKYSETLRILIVDDEASIRRYLRLALNTVEFEVHEAADGRSALAAGAAACPDLILLDLGLPDMDGMEVLRRIRQCCNVPVIILSVRGNEDDKVKALDSGADDYLTKPFGTGELLARIRAAMRRSRQGTAEPVYKIDDLVVDVAQRRVTVQGNEVQLTATEFELLHLLVIHAGRVLTHRRILQKLWGSAYLDQPNVLRVTISNLRHKIEPDASRPRYILTELGVGYRLRMDQ